MSEELNFYIEESKESMESTIHHFESELGKIRAGKASPQILDGIMVNYYDVETPINQVANIGNLDNKTLVIQPWEKNMLGSIEKAIMAANIGATPQSDGNVIRISMPPLTEERRMELVKSIKNMAEQSRVSIRNTRRDAKDAIKKLQNEGVSEDLARDAENEVQKNTDDYISMIDKQLEAKEKEVMTV